MALFETKNILIRGIHSTTPAQVEENANLDLLTPKQKKDLIITTGIERRRIAGNDETAADLCCSSAQSLLQQLAWKPDEIDIIIFITQTPDYIIPATSMHIQHRLKLPNSCMAIDINQGCSGYVYGLSVISAMMNNSGFKKGLLLVGDTLTRTFPKEDMSLVPIFSDAGSCTALEYSANCDPMHFHLQSDGGGFDKIIIPSGGSRDPEGPNDQLKMNGQDIFHFGLNSVVPNIQGLLKFTNSTIEEIDYFVMHQANQLLNEAIRKMVKIDSDKTLYSLRDYGNTSCATIPLTLAYHNELLSSIKKDKVLLCGFGVGLSWGSALISLSGLKSLLIHESGH